MDTSKTYIKMVACPEIQSQRPNFASWEDGDFYLADKHTWIYLGITLDSDITQNHRDNGMLWLPRQDQLQEICHRFDYPYMLLEQFYRFTKGLKNLLSTYEQLWLTFVMKERYQKIWNGEDWVKE